MITDNPTGPKSATLEGPEVLPGKSRTIKWHTVFLTPFDPHYTISIAGQGVEMSWSMWTASKVCF